MLVADSKSRGPPLSAYSTSAPHSAPEQRAHDEPIQQQADEVGAAEEESQQQREQPPDQAALAEAREYRRARIAVLDDPASTCVADDAACSTVPTRVAAPATTVSTNATLAERSPRAPERRAGSAMVLRSSEAPAKRGIATGARTSGRASPPRSRETSHSAGIRVGAARE